MSQLNYEIFNVMYCYLFAYSNNIILIIKVVAIYEQKQFNYSTKQVYNKEIYTRPNARYI